MAAESAPRQRVSATWRALIGWSKLSQRAASAAARGWADRAGAARAAAPAIGPVRTGSSGADDGGGGGPVAGGGLWTAAEPPEMSGGASAVWAAREAILDLLWRF